MKKIVLSYLCFFLAGTLLFAQESSDANAQALLEKARKKYESYKNLEADFSLTIEPAEGKREIQKGKIWQSGDKYRIKLDQQEIVCDGKSSWLYLKRNKEVQINDADTQNDANSLSPKGLLRMYHSGNFLYFMGSSGTEGGKAVQYIEIKPVDRRSEYSKFRVAISKSNNQIVSMKTFNKDGSKFTMNISKLNTSKAIDSKKFIFDVAQYPGTHVEDLRTN
jgi:outer membrane lipoprotein-sorting protein